MFEMAQYICMDIVCNVVCVDATHGTSIYTFFLVTMLTMDEYGEGIPVAWMLSNREDAMALHTFFTSIKTACGDIEAAWFMSDDAEQYFNAWKGVFTVSKTNKLLCNWHVHQSWRKAIHQYIKDTRFKCKCIMHYVSCFKKEINHTLRFTYNNF